MGNWNRKYQPRKKCRYDQFEEPMPSSSRSYHTQSNSFELEDNRVSSWEIDYCNSLKVPWYKIFASKKYIYCYPTVQNWDDSAGQEAFDSAKQRYWKKINGFPCDIPLPDPDMFIDEIDWNPYLDPELMLDIETLYFNPDKSKTDDELETINEEVEHAQVPNDTNQCADNPWEKDHPHDSPSFRDTLKGWRQYHDPWEQNPNNMDDSSDENGWRNGNGTSDWSRWPCNVKPSSQAVVGQQEGWGCYKNNTSSWGHGNANNQEFGSSGKCECSWANDWSTGSRERSWRDDNGNGSWISRESVSKGYEPNCWNRGGFRRGHGRLSFHGGERKTESSLRYTTKHKSSRYQRL